MKIGMFLDTSFPPDPRVENEATSLIKDGHELFLFTLERNGIVANTTINGIQVVRYKYSWWLYKLSALVYTFPFFTWLVKPLVKDFIRQYRVEVLHVHDMILADAVLQVNRRFKLPTVLDLHENRPAIMKHYKHVNSFSGKLLINLNRWARKQQALIASYDKVIVVTQEAKNIILSEQPTLKSDHITVVPNSIRKSIFLNYEIEESIVNHLESRQNIIYVGDTGIRRGIDTVIKAIRVLHDDGFDIHFVVVGKGADDNYLKALSEDLGVKELVHFVGWQDLTLFPSYMAAADVGISPIKRNLHHDTTFANKVFQYMAMKLPLLVSDCPPQVTIVEGNNCGLVFKADDEQDLAVKIKTMFSNKDQMAKFATNGYNAILNTYHWGAVDQSLLSLYQNPMR